VQISFKVNTLRQLVVS